MTRNTLPVLMTEEYWANSQFSVARYYGQISVGGHRFLVVNKEGKDLFELSVIAEREGREKAIEPGEPADLIREEFIPLYKKFGRDAFIEVLKANHEIFEPKQMKPLLEAYVQNPR